MLVKDWMTSPVVTISPTAFLGQAKKLFYAHNIRTLVVMDGGNMMGTISRRAVFRHYLSVVEKSPTDQIDATVSSVMNHAPTTISPESSMQKAARLFLEHHITALPVISSTTLVGMLTYSDLLRYIDSLPLLNSTLVDELMSRKVTTIAASTPILEAYKLMLEKHIRSLPVLEEENLVGIITQTDLLNIDQNDLNPRTNRSNQQFWLKVLTQPVSEMMSKQLLTLKRHSTVSDATKMMLTNKVHSLLITDDEKKIKGIITGSDLFLLLIQKYSTH